MEELDKGIQIDSPMPDFPAIPLYLAFILLPNCETNAKTRENDYLSVLQESHVYICQQRRD